MKKFTIPLFLAAVHLCTTTQAQPNTFPASGNVGIGTTSPQQRLHVEGGGNIAMFVSTTPLNVSPGSGMIGYTQHLPTASGQRLGFFLLGSRGGGNQYYHGVGMAGYAQGAWNANSWPAYLTFETTPSGSNTRVERLRVAADGNVGIGTTSPNTVLHVNSTVAGQNPFRVQVNGGTRLYVDENGGVAVGGLATPPASGLYVAGNTGVGTTVPERRLHVFEGSAGVVTANGDAPLVVENNTNSFINVLAPTNAEKGILFGNPGNAQNGGLIYSGASNSLLFRTNGNITRMSLSSAGNLDIAGGLLSFGTVEALSDGGTNTISSNSNLVPTFDNSRSLGLSGLRWSAVWAADGTINTSDARLKSNVRDLDYGLKEIMKLRSTRFNWKSRESEGDKLGFIAQELKAVLPEVVRDWDYEIDEQTGERKKVPAVNIGVAYSDIIPVLIKGMQEQQGLIEKQQQQIEELKLMVNKLANGQTVSPLTGGDALLQNVPNPVKGTTAIQYSIPEGAGRAQLLMTDALGRTIKAVQLTTSGVVNVDVSTLSSGVYNYSLMVDGKILQTKRMTVTR